MYAKALKLRLEKQCACEVIAIYQTAVGFLTHLNSISCDYIIIDYKLPDKNGSEVLHNLCQKEIAIPVILITAYKFPEYLEVINAEGAVAYVEKGEIDSICEIISGKESFAYVQLTNAEHDFITAILRQPSNKELAQQFSITVDAVKKRKSKLSKKLRIANNYPSFVKYAHLMGWK